jgi:hypothetical protein
MVAGLADLFRIRHTIGTPQRVLWAALIVMLPIAGLISYLFWRIARADSMQEAMHYHDDQSEGTDPESPIRY